MRFPLPSTINRIQNAIAVKKKRISLPKTKMGLVLVQFLYKEGYITAYTTKSTQILVYFKYYGDTSVIKQIIPISTPSKQVYVSNHEILRSYLGTFLISTSYGILSDKEAYLQGVGGKVLCYVM